jgi:hypothetical protein
MNRGLSRFFTAPCSRLSPTLGPGTSQSHKQPVPLACHSQRPDITRAVYTLVALRSVSERYLDRPSRAFQLSNLIHFLRAGPNCARTSTYTEGTTAVPSLPMLLTGSATRYGTLGDSWLLLNLLPFGPSPYTTWRTRIPDRTNQGYC